MPHGRVGSCFGDAGDHAVSTVVVAVFLSLALAVAWMIGNEM